MKLLKNTKNEITNENEQILPNLEITEVVLVYCSIVNNDFQ